MKTVLGSYRYWYLDHKLPFKPEACIHLMTAEAYDDSWKIDTWVKQNTTGKVLKERGMWVFESGAEALQCHLALGT